MTKTKHLDSDLLTEALRNLRQQSSEHAATMQEAIAAGGIPNFMTVAAAQGMKDTHERREKECEILLNALEQAQEVLIRVEPCEECSQDICVCDLELDAEEIRDFQIG